MGIMDDLKQRREELTAQLTVLRTQRDRAFRANSDALARTRAGITDQDEVHMKRLADDEVAGDAKMSDLRRELKTIDAEFDEHKGVRHRILRLLGR